MTFAVFHAEGNMPVVNDKLCKTCPSIIQQFDKASSSSSVRILPIPFIVPGIKVTEDDNRSRSVRNGRDGLTQAREEGRMILPWWPMTAENIDIFVAIFKLNA